MNFTYLDLTFLALFCIFLFVFLYPRRKKLDREGLMFLYRTTWGIKLINYVGTKYKKTLKVLSYFSVITGYVLMGSIIYFVGKIVYIYIRYPEVVRTIKVPPLMPLVPYLPQMFNLDFLPPFYFTYWIIIIAIIAITHEFSHGIFAKYAGVDIKSTGFGFLGPFLAAFVEPDEKKLQKKDKFSQIAMLSAGTFANVLTAIIFLIILGGFFYVSFVPSGVVFDNYAYNSLQLNEIEYVNGIKITNTSYENIEKYLFEENKLNEIKTSKGNFLSEKESIKLQKNNDFLVLYADAPAIRNNLSGAITEINNVKIENVEKLREELGKYSSGEEITIKTIYGKEIKEYTLILEDNPFNEGAWIGIGFYEQERTGVVNYLIKKLSFFKEDNVYYVAKNENVIFFYNLFWWIILISISVALVNMVPVGIFDGGRVFYLTLMFFTKKEDVPKKIFKAMTYLFLFLLFVLMFFWFVSFI